MRTQKVASSEAPSLPRAGSLNIPPHVADCEDSLRYYAGCLLRHQSVRSITVHRERGEIIVNSVDQVTITADSATPPVDVLIWSDPQLPYLYCIRAPNDVAGWQRALFVLAGAAFTVIAALGVILPGLPTTPFVLLASYCFLRSSRRLHEMLLRNRLFGGVLRDWYLHRGLRPHVRYKALAVLAVVVAASLYWGGLPLWANFLVSGIAAFGAVYVWRLPNVRD